MIPGLELHELDGETAFYLSKEAKTTDLARTATELEEERAVEEELKEAKTEMKEAEREVTQCKLTCYVFVFLTLAFLLVHLANTNIKMNKTCLS